MKRNQFWAGFIDNRLDIGSREMNLFRTKAGAEKMYEDVRKVELVEVTRSKGEQP